MLIKGRITKLLPVTEFTSKSGNTFKKQQFVFTYKKDEQHPRALVLEAFGEENIAKYNLVEGATYEADVEFEAHEWNNRYFTDIRLFSISPLQTASAPAQVAPTPPPPPQPAFTQVEDDCPF